MFPEFVFSEIAEIPKIRIFPNFELSKFGLGNYGFSERHWRRQGAHGTAGDGSSPQRAHETPPTRTLTETAPGTGRIHVLLFVLFVLAAGGARIRSTSKRKRWGANDLCQ